MRSTYGMIKSGVIIPHVVSAGQVSNPGTETIALLKAVLFGAAAGLPFLGPGGPVVGVPLPPDAGASRRPGAVYSSGIQQRHLTRSHATSPHLPRDQDEEPSTS